MISRSGWDWYRLQVTYFIYYAITHKITIKKLIGARGQEIA